MAPSCGLSGLQPLRQKRVGVDVGALVVTDAALVEPAPQRAVAPCIEQIGAAADVHAADVDVRDGPRAGALRDHGADVPAPISCLAIAGVEIDAQVLHTDPCEELADGPAELAPH